MIDPFSLFGISVTELLLRVEFQWTQVVAAQISHRACFDGLAGVDPGDTSVAFYVGWCGSSLGPENVERHTFHSER